MILERLHRCPENICILAVVIPAFEFGNIQGQQA